MRPGSLRSAWWSRVTRVAAATASTPTSIIAGVTLLDADGPPVTDPARRQQRDQGIVANWGDTMSTGLHVTIVLPKDVTFPGAEGCTLSADGHGGLRRR